MTSTHFTGCGMAVVAIMDLVSRKWLTEIVSVQQTSPGTPTDQAWIETLFGDLKAEWPHLLAIRDPAILRAELPVVRAQYNGVRPPPSTTSPPKKGSPGMSVGVIRALARGVGAAGSVRRTA